MLEHIQTKEPACKVCAHLERELAREKAAFVTYTKPRFARYASMTYLEVQTLEAACKAFGKDIAALKRKLDNHREECL